MRHTAFLSVILSVGLPPTFVYSQQVGDKIVVIDEHAPLQADNKTTGSVPKEEILVVKEVSGDRVRVIYSNGHETVKGWLNRSDVMPFSQALAFFNAELKRNPTARSYAIRGRIWGHKAEFDKAISDFNEAIRIDPNNAKAYSNRAGAWAFKKEYDKAISDLSEAVRLNPKRASAYGNRGGVWFAKNEYEKAISDLSEAIRLTPNEALAYANRGAVWQAKREYDKAISDFNEAIRLLPKFASLRRERGKVWLAKGGYKEAISDCDEAIRLCPTDERAYICRGNAWMATGQHDTAIWAISDYEMAVADYTEAIQLDPADAKPYVGRGDAWKAKGEYNKAITDYDEAIRIDPKSASPWNQRAWFMATCSDAKYRNGKQAVDNAKKACELTDWKSEDSLSTLAAAYAESGDFANAVKSQEKAIELAPETSKGKLRSRLDLYKAHMPYRDETKK